MKNAVGTATNEGNIDVTDGEPTKISEAAYGVLMDLLSNIYTNSAEAVLREYSVNGWDEHTKHGVERPVEVSLPTILQPTLEIRDFAKGLPRNGTFHMEGNKKVWDEYGVMQVFGEYGESSKRDNDDEVGGFGIGSKAAFALGHQFIVTSYKDGQVFSVLFTINQDGTGSCSDLFEGETDEPNGVKISLAVDDVDFMNESAERFFSFWNRGDVLVNGEEPTPIFERLDKVSDEIFLDQDGRGEAYAVMGPVAYPVDRAILRKVTAYLEEQGLGEVATLPTRLVDSDTDVYLRVPIGSVKPAPNREALRDRDITIRTLGSVFLAIHQESQVKIQTDVDAAPSYAAAARTFHRANTTLGAFSVERKTVTWNGKTMRRTAPVDLTNYTLVNKSWRNNSPKVVGEDSAATLEVGGAEKAIVVTGVDEDNQGPVRRFAKRFLEGNEDGIERIFVSPATAASYGWFQFGVEGGFRTVDLEGWRTILRGMRKSTPRTVNEPSYSVGFTDASRDLDDRDLLSDILAEGKDLVLFTDSARHLNAYERAALADYTVVVLLGTQSEDALHKRVEKDEETDLKIVPWSEIRPNAVKAAKAHLKSMTRAEREALGAREWISEHKSECQTAQNVVSALSLVGEVTSPALLAPAEALELAEAFAEPLTDIRYKSLLAAYQYVKGLSRYSTEEFVTAKGRVYEDDTVATDLRDQYPLLTASEVNQRARSIRTRTGEDGEIAYSWSFTEENHLANLRYLEHTLTYVNAL